MSVSVSNVNYATPIFSSIQGEGFVDNAKYFSLHDNTLDGSYKLMGEGPLWGGTLSDTAGALATPLIVTVEETSTMHTLRLRGDTAINLYPTKFTFTLYNGNTVLFSQEFINNDVEWVHYLDAAYSVTKYTIAITQLNKPGYVVRVTNIFNPHELHRSVPAPVNLSEQAVMSVWSYLLSTDTLKVAATVSNALHVLTESSDVLDMLCAAIQNAMTNDIAGIDDIVLTLNENVAIYNRLKLQESLNILAIGNAFIHNKAIAVDTLATNATVINKMSIGAACADTLDLLHTTVKSAMSNSIAYIDDIVLTLNENVAIYNRLKLQESLNILAIGNAFIHNKAIAVDTLATNATVINKMSIGAACADTLDLLHTTVKSAMSNSIVDIDGISLTLNDSVAIHNDFALQDVLNVLLTDNAFIHNKAMAVDTLATNATVSNKMSIGAACADTLDLLHTTAKSTMSNSIAYIDGISLTLNDSVAMHNDFALQDSLNVLLTDNAFIHNKAMAVDTLATNATVSNILHVLAKNTATLDVNANIDEVITNVHTRMKDTTRKVYGKVRITYMNPLLDNNFEIASSGAAYNTDIGQTLDGVKDSYETFFMLHNNKLDGSYSLIGSNSKVGWWSSALSTADGTFAVSPVASFNFSPRLIQSLSIVSSRAHGVVLVDFTVNVLSNGTVQTYNIIGNDLYECPINSSPLAEVTNVDIIIHKINKGHTPANITEVTISSTVLYNQEDLMSIDFLEELSYKDEIESLGGVSANEITVTISNEFEQFYFNNPKAIIARQLKKNRKIEAYLGTEIIPGEIEWYQLGVFWSYSWDVPVGELYAKVVAFDTIGLLNTKQFRNRQVLVGKSVGEAIEYVLNDAKLSFYTGLAWSVAPALFDIIIPYIWFDDGTYQNALDQLTQCCRIRIYCDRTGKIVANARGPISFFYDTWSDSTNVLNKTYPTLYTDIPNTVTVRVTTVSALVVEVISNTKAFTVSGDMSISLKASKPIVANEVITVDADATVLYDCEVYSWGVVFNFSGAGAVRSIKVVAEVLDITQDTSVTLQNAEAVILNGEVEKDISHVFIQTTEHANYLANAILEDVATDVYDADVNYIGDISLTISDPIVLKDNITPTDKYRIKRHTLYWDGSLTGTAKLNT